MFFKRKPKEQKKVYCLNCVNYASETLCITGKKDTPISIVSIYGNCNELNKNNDCDRFKKNVPFEY